MIDNDILSDFQKEAKGLLNELEPIVEKLEEVEEGFPSNELAQFAQRIDRIMGAAETLNQLDTNHQGLKRIGAIARLCKGLGYKAAELKTSELIPIFAAFWADTLEVLSGLIDAIADEAKSKSLADSSAKILQGRLDWLAAKVEKSIPNSGIQSQMEIIQALAHFKK
jgi:hypothetical protein